MHLRSLWVLGVALSTFVALSRLVMAEDGRPLGTAETVEIGGVRNILVRVDRPRGSLVVLTGGDGVLAVDSRGKFTGNARASLFAIAMHSQPAALTCCWWKREPVLPTLCAIWKR